MAKTLAELITDWGGFERLVAELHATGHVAVQHNVVLPGKSGAPRQIDVLVTHTTDMYEHRIVVECKLWNENVSRLHVDALATTVRELNASRGVIFTTKGFQSGAEAQARADGIDLFVVRELTDEEWGLPGPVIDFVLQLWQRSIFDLRIENATILHGGVAPVVPKLQLHLSDAKGDHSATRTPTVDSTGAPLRSLEERIATASAKALEHFTTPPFTINGGAPGVHYMQGEVNLEPPDGLLVPIVGGLLRIGRITFQLGMKVQQGRITRDRRDSFVYALAVENRLTSQVFAASRPADGAARPLTELHLIAHSAADRTNAVKNGSVIRATIEGFFPPDEMRGLTPTDVVMSRPGRA